ncbi:hypothetical protein CRG98_040758 [Punica granatum]|uniref:Uncharacterized protein n=1 Tax=Punica granatum TaxID=22663 RepID=A0A2I0I4G1_PUNGR|nr:hypothetical protein CRG98_040758 [Punica granatum]
MDRNWVLTGLEDLSPIGISRFRGKGALSEAIPPPPSSPAAIEAISDLRGGVVATNGVPPPQYLEIPLELGSLDLGERGACRRPPLPLRGRERPQRPQATTDGKGSPPTRRPTLVIRRS